MIRKRNLLFCLPAVALLAMTGVAHAQTLPPGIEPNSPLAKLDHSLVAAGKVRIARMDAERVETQKGGDAEVPPFKLVGNTYSVGIKAVTSYVIKTSDGLILVDMTYDRTAPWVAKAIESLGFRLSDIKIILGSHSHGDHVGGMAYFKAHAPQAKVMIMDADAPILEKGVPGRGPGGTGGIPPVKVDRVLKDGDKITLGDTTLTAWKTAGHTPGATSLEWKQTENGKTYNVVLVGSQFTAIEGYPGVKEDQIKTWNRYLSLNADIWVGGHTWQHEQRPKYAALIYGDPAVNPFYDPQGYRELIAARAEEFLERLRNPAAPDSRGRPAGAPPSPRP
jgi:metallo-beta-lactamase class B